MVLEHERPGHCRSNTPARCRVSVLVVICLVGFTACEGAPGFPPDDAKAAGMTTVDFPQASVDVFSQMDGGLPLTADEIRGRNSWLLWTAGNQVFWDRVAREGYGLVDLLKTLDSRQRPIRFAEMGLINEPGFRRATKADAYGLWLDESVEPGPAGIDERIYGRSSGVIGLRIYPNPNFVSEAKTKWDPDRYYTEPSYFTDPRLVRPYRIGVTCALCHVGPHPLHPPPDPENPKWEHLASAIGNQYLREGKVFAVGARPGSFLWEMLNAQPPGTSDTSRAASDHINNPGAINAIFEVDARLAEGAEEKMSGGARALAGARARRVPHILKDGADSVGVAGAMMRVYVNEGLYSQEWLTDHQLLLGLRAQRPFSVTGAAKNSVYWQATAERVDNIAKFFRRITPMHLEDAPGGAAYITPSTAVLDRGKMIFGELCAACHSSKQPPAAIEPRSPEALQWYRASVMRADFRDGNFLSDERRYPISRIKTNACRALATNATAGNIWDNFSSDTYKALEPVEVIETFNPADPAKPYRFKPPAGGPGY
jgi:cytochrome c5